jgi:prolyl-tRNA synthetase
MEVGHIFKLGYKYSKSMGLNVLNESGEETPVIMGSYGIGVERILSAAIELFHDKDGISLPASIAPFDCAITVVNAKDEVMSNLGREIYEAAKSAGLDPLFDDRDERPGVKFKDADLIGIPWRITVGKKAAQGVVEVVERRTKSMTEMPASEAAAYVQSRTA